ncbi:hypothetical protein QR680_009827 [Steinernema hermaphroditum]|uniref:Uncharacterized protein n=1 Tax=Steinernema hermaphroditum TaxID=289476 RepID=A0AA39IP74_9BILA|nr:hypothetical protein QR680_009827 [Steinernema hermaphroditum]
MGGYERLGLSDEQLFFFVVFRLTVFGVFTPLYAGLLLILATQKQFRSTVAYNIMVQIGLIDLFSILTTGLFAVMSIYRENFYVISTIVVYFRALYFVLLFSFSLLLALNRFFVYNQIKRIRPSYYKYLSVLLWLLLGVLLPLWLCVHSETVGEYDYQFAMAFTDGFVAQRFVRFLEIGLSACSIATYILIVFQIIMKRLRFNLKVRLSSPETRILLQAFLLFFPPVVVFSISMTMFSFSTSGLLLLSNRSIVLMINIISDILPVVNLGVQLAFNAAIKGFILQKICKEVDAVEVFKKSSRTLFKEAARDDK